MKSIRDAFLLDGITKSNLGIEIAPWFVPLVPRRKGYNVKIIDVFDKETLRKRGLGDPNLAGYDMDQLDEVDYVGSATEIASLVPEDMHGKFDYIVSSHNFEHLPNPIKFLRGCEQVLRPGGVLAMAVPDMRACFDFFRPQTTVGEWIEAYIGDIDRPTPRQIFDFGSQVSHLETPRGGKGAFWIGAPIQSMRLDGDLHLQYATWRKSEDSDDYKDVHCTVMTPASLELMLFETHSLGLISMVVEGVSETNGCEFWIRLRKPLLKENTGEVRQEVNKKRRELMVRAMAQRTLQIGDGSSREDIFELIKANGAALERTKFRRFLSDLNRYRKQTRKRKTSREI